MVNPSFKKPISPMSLCVPIFVILYPLICCVVSTWAYIEIPVADEIMKTMCDSNNKEFFFEEDFSSSLKDLCGVEGLTLRSELSYCHYISIAYFWYAVAVYSLSQYDFLTDDDGQSGDGVSKVQVTGSQKEALEAKKKFKFHVRWISFIVSVLVIATCVTSFSDDSSLVFGMVSDNSVQLKIPSFTTFPVYYFCLRGQPNPNICTMLQPNKWYSLRDLFNSPLRTIISKSWIVTCVIWFIKWYQFFCCKDTVQELDIPLHRTPENLITTEKPIEEKRGTDSVPDTSDIKDLHAVDKLA